MSIKPILFNSDMVRAILDGRKMVTRRVMKPQPWKIGEGEHECQHEKGFFDTGGNDWACRQCGCGVIPMKGGSYFHASCQPGDMLYVRETWQPNPYGAGWPYFYKASQKDCDPEPGKWRPSIHMPREAARIWLKVTDVRVERLQDITVEQAIKEGVLVAASFGSFWDSTIKKTDLSHYGWDANPWVWVIEFYRYEKPEKEKYGKINIK